MRYYDFSVQST